MSATVPVQDFVYDEIVRGTEEIDFGISTQALLSGAQAIPPEGVRLNGSFEGELTGPRIKGKIVGTDYALIRGDGVMMLNVQAVITTHDGERIALHADGIGTIPPGASTMQLRENVTLHTAAPEYAWVNRQQFWATGHADLVKRETTLKGYAA